MKIVLIRHSKTERNPKIPILQWGLSEDGIALAKKLSQKEIIKKVDVLYSSFQTKALETSVLIAKPNAVPIKADDSLTEVTSFTGPFEKDFDKYTKNVHDYYLGTIKRISGGETQKEALKRFNAVLESIAKKEVGKEYVGIVTHGNILTLFSSQFRHVDCFALHTQIKQPDVALFDWEKKKFISFFGEL
ncbi:MAG: histidine phosphatase family protein [Candidatus Levyibacteriota bacterium]